MQVLINIRAAPINPGDLYTVHMGGAGSADTISKPPFIAGNDGVGVVVKVGPGVKNLSENDWVFPFKFGLGTWRSLVVWKEKDLLKMPVRSPCRPSHHQRALSATQHPSHSDAAVALTLTPFLGHTMEVSGVTVTPYGVHRGI